MIKQASCAMLAISLLATGIAFASEDDGDDAAHGAKKLTEATAVYNELITTRDRAIPKELLENCKCVAVLPGVIKAALGYGARHGSGVMICRTSAGWSDP